MNGFSQIAGGQVDKLTISALSCMDQGLVVSDQNGRLVYCNPAAESIFGPPPSTKDAAAWVGNGLYIPNAASPCPIDQFPLTRAICGESVEATEFLLVRSEPEAADLWISATARPLRDDGGTICGAVAIIVEITAARRATEILRLAQQESESANGAKSRFLYRISRELRESLTTILGFAQMLTLESLTEQQSNCRRHILTDGYHLFELMNEVLDAAPVKAGEFNLCSEPVRIREALMNALPTVQPFAAQLGVTIGPSIPLRCDRHTRADRKWLKQVLIDLLSNAVMLSGRGGSIAFSCEETLENRIRLEISYSGSDQMEGALELSESLDVPTEALGPKRLGLTRCERIIEAMGGTIGTSETGSQQGTFSIELSLIEDPLERLDQDVKAMGRLVNNEPKPLCGTVLCIDDNPTNLRLIKDILAYHPGVQFLPALGSLIGLDLAIAHSPDWILLDLHLPQMPGEEVLRRLMDDPITRHIPITVLSGDTSPERIRGLLTAGARDYLSKPLSVERLLSLLEKTLGRGDSSASV